MYVFKVSGPSLFLQLGLRASMSNVCAEVHEDCTKFEPSEPWLPYRWSWGAGGALILPATQLPRPPLLLKAVLQSERPGVGSPEFSLLLGTAPRPRPLHRQAA